MAEPKKETVRIALPPRPDKAPPAPSSIKRDTARIVLPSRTPVAPLRRLPPKITPLPSADSTTEAPTISVRRPPVAPPQVTATSPLLRPLPKPPGPETSAESGAAINPLPAASPGGEEADFESNAGASIQPARKRRPRASHPAPGLSLSPNRRSTDKNAAAADIALRRECNGAGGNSSKPLDPFELLPKPFVWGWFGIASVIFLIKLELLVS